MTRKPRALITREERDDLLEALSRCVTSLAQMYEEMGLVLADAHRLLEQYDTDDGSDWPAPVRRSVSPSSRGTDAPA